MDLDGERTGIDALVDDEITGDDVTDAKPAPEPVVKAIEGLRTATRRARSTSATDPTTSSPARAPARSPSASASASTRDEMREAGPDHVIDHPSEILGLIDARTPA